MRLKKFFRNTKINTISENKSPLIVPIANDTQKSDVSPIKNGAKPKIVEIVVSQIGVILALNADRYVFKSGLRPAFILLL